MAGPDEQALRRETPGTKNVTHFNNAGASLPIQEVLDVQNEYLEAEALYGGYEVVTQHSEQLQRPYDALASLLNCAPQNIAILQSATSAWAQVFYGIPLKAGDRILTSIIEYGANYIAFLQMAKRTGVAIEVIPEDDEGDISLPALEVLITQGDRKPALIAITHVPTNSGRVYDAAGVGRLAQAHGVPYLLDACQSVGQLPLDVEAIGCDWLSGTSRKYLRGPRGVGFLYASDSAMERFEPAMLDLYGATWTASDQYQMQPGARRYEIYEKNFAGMVGLGVAVDYANRLGMNFIWARIQAIASELRGKLAMIPGVTVHDRGRLLCGIVSFTKEGVDPGTITAHLFEQGINVKTSAITSTRLDFERVNLPPAVVRASVHYFNTSDEIEQLVSAVAASV
ncbi:probable cysteine desulfurase [Coccomyxa sp. Obi]|nr:probable cysteine desulfurase [Coccomyxa sp. Obi]